METAIEVGWVQVYELQYSFTFEFWGDMCYIYLQNDPCMFKAELLLQLTCRCMLNKFNKQKLTNKTFPVLWKKQTGDTDSRKIPRTSFY